MKNRKRSIAPSFGTLALVVSLGVSFDGASSVHAESTTKPLTANQLLDQLAKKGVKVEETYTSHAVWWPVNGVQKLAGYVWLTNQGALETWQVFTNPTQENYTSYSFQQTNTFTTVNFSASNAVDWYYSDPKCGPILGPGSTVYSYNSIIGEYPALFLAENLVPHYVLANNQNVYRMSNGEYVYGNGKVFWFNHFVQIPESEVPSNYASQLISWGENDGHPIHYWYRVNSASFADHRRFRGRLHAP